MNLKTSALALAALAALSASGSGAAADSPYQPVPLLNIPEQLPEGFASFAKVAPLRLQEENARWLNRSAAPDYRCSHRGGYACEGADPAEQVFGYFDAGTIADLWGTLKVTAGEQPGELCAPGLYEFDADLLVQAHEKLGAASVEHGVDWRAAQGDVPVFGSPLAEVQIAVLSDEMVYAPFYLAIHGAGEDSLRGWARQQVVLPDGRRGFVHADQLSSLETDRMCFSRVDGKWKISSLTYAYVP